MTWTIMQNFKQYLNSFICEALELHKGTISYTRKQSNYASSKGLISTFHKAKDSFLTKANKDLKGETVYSLYNYKSDEESKEIISAIKGLSQTHHMEDKQYNWFIEDSVEYALTIIKHLNINYIVYPTSSSPFLGDFIEALSAKLNNITVIKDAIVKKQLENIEQTAQQLIDPNYYGIEKLTPEKRMSIIKQIIRNVKQNEADGKGSIITLKNIGFKRDNHYLHKFMEAVNESILEIENQHVLVIDDLIGSGTSFAELFRVVKEFTPSSVVGLTIFKGSGS
jgi:phosphoribosylpyrophosphate synthetase